MAFKKNYLIKVWDTSKKKDKELDKQIETENDGFDLIQERIIKCYETNIKNLSVPKGLRATYEEVQEKTTTPKKDRPATANTNR
jgi:hypothetical protein